MDIYTTINIAFEVILGVALVFFLFALAKLFKAIKDL